MQHVRGIGAAGRILLALALGPGACLAYDYPITDRFAATIVGTPTEVEATLPEKIPLHTYRLPPDRAVPDVFWHQRGLEFSLARQKGRAPLVFLVAGTGAAHDSAKMRALDRALFAAGFHVLNLSSSTHLNFIVNESASGLAGYLPDDTRDMYRVMERAWAMVRKDVDASEFLVAGYSLGGITAAFLALHDETAHSFGFRRALMINPPVDLYNSVRLLDGYLTDNVARGRAGEFLDEAINRLAVAYQPDQGMRMDEDFLFRAYRMNLGAGRRDPLASGNAPAALIGLSFRVSSSAIVFAGDVMAHTGYITPKNKTFGADEGLDYYAWASSQVPFTRYVDELLLPALMKMHPGATREQLLRAASLHGIEPFLRNGDKVWALTNADEIILAPGELNYLKDVLGSRVRVYPHGGHCGNITQRETVRDIIAVLRGEALSGGGV